MILEKVALTEEKETLLITLYAKGQESRLPDSLLRPTLPSAPAVVRHRVVESALVVAM